MKVFWCNHLAVDIGVEQLGMKEKLKYCGHTTISFSVSKDRFKVLFVYVSLICLDSLTEFLNRKE